MRNFLPLVVYLILILGSENAAAAANQSSSEATFPSVSSTPVTLQPSSGYSTVLHTFPTSESSGPSQQNPTSESTSGSSSVSRDSGILGVGQTTMSTTIDPGPWKVVTFALIGLSCVLLAALIATVFILCKMRTKLRQASKTLYPITPDPEDHEYLDIETGDMNSHKVELTRMAVHREEVFDSPTLSQTVPEKPKRNPPPEKPSRKAPSLPERDELPQVPARTKKKYTTSKLSKKDTQSTSLVGQEEEAFETNAGEVNPAFVGDEVHQRKGTGISSHTSSISEISVLEEHDELYEQYENNRSAGLVKGTLNFAIEKTENDETDSIRAYEEPVKTSERGRSTASQLINRQGSSTGLPELLLERVSSRGSMQDAPLHVTNEDEDDIEDFGVVDMESGLPNMNGMHNFDEDEFFDDPDKMTQETNGEDNENTDVSGDEEHDAPSMDDVLTYDDADMAIADDDEPGFYEDFELSTKSEKNVNTEIASPSMEQTAFPKVPPRRDLLRQQSEADGTVGSFDEMVLTEANQQLPDQFSDNEVQLRMGRQVSAQGQVNPRDSYYLFKDDKTEELNDNNTRELTVTDTFDQSGFDVLSGISESSQINVDLKGPIDTETGLVPRSQSVDSDSGERASFDMYRGVPGAENEMYINGTVPNTGDGAGLENWYTNTMGQT